VELNQALSAKMNLYPQAICEKEVTIQLLQDENATLQLEIRKIELLQCWLKKMNEEAEKMNEANQFYVIFLKI
jgi:autophagy-related protein 16